MRPQVFVFLAAALLCCVGLFLPVGQVDVAGRTMTAPATISLYKLGNSDAEVKKFLRGYRDSATKRLSAKALAKVTPHLKGGLRSDAEDVQEAMDLLDTIKDEDVRLVTNIVAGVVWALLGLNLVGAYLLLGADPAGGRRRWRAIGTVITSLLAAAISIVLYEVLTTAVAEANSEMGRDLFSLRAGAYMVPVAAVIAAVAAIATLVSFARRRLPRGPLPGQPMPPPPA